MKVRSKPAPADLARGAGLGLTAAVVALGVAELLAALWSGFRSPILDVGDRVIDLVPPAVKNLAIDLFGTADKIALLVGIAVILAGCAVAIGVLTERGRLSLGVLGVSLFGVVGSLAAVSSREDRPVLVVIPSVVGAAAGAATLIYLHRLGRGDAAAGASDRADSGAGAAVPARRSVLVAGGALFAGGVLAGAAGRWLAGRFSAATARASLVLPPLRRELPPIPSGVEVDVDGVSPFITPNSDFYRIDTALLVPQVDLESWRLRVTGMVDRPMELTFDELVGRGLVEADITLACVSNEVGGDLIGNARWAGVRLDELLADAGVRSEADQVVGRSVDGYTCGFPVAAATDGRAALVAVSMNGEPLPLRHGFPARLVVPGLYGYVSATKWLSEIELTRFDRFDQYWVPRGWSAEAPIKTSSRIDTPRGLSRIPAGETMVAGVAWAQGRGISGVQLSVDDGPWQDATLAEALSEDTWRQWRIRWDATPGRHELAVRAIDGTGAIQTAERSEPMPNGATGHHRVVVMVEG